MKTLNSKKVSTLAAGALLSASLLAPALALAATGSDIESDSLTDAKKGGLFLGTAVAGAVLGGPIGFIAGALGGVWMGNEVEQAQHYELGQQQLSQQQLQMTELEDRLAVAEQSSSHYAQLALQQLQLEMLFKTGDSELTLSGKQRMIQLAEYLNMNPDISVRLDGYADPRGDADFNMQLSQARVGAVAEHLQALGLPQARIDRYSHGAEQSQAMTGDYDGYAMERLVRIQLSRGGEMESLAQVSIHQ